MLVLDSGGVSFLHSDEYEAVFWICAEHTNDNRDVLVTAEQDLHRARAFSAFCTATLVRRHNLARCRIIDLVCEGYHI